MGNLIITAQDNTNRALKALTVNITNHIRITIKKFIKWGLVASMSEYVRRAVNNQMIIDLELMEKVEDINKGILNDNMVRIPGESHIYKIVRRLDNYER